MGWTLVIIAIVLSLFNGKKPSSIHDPRGFKDHSNLRSIIGGIFMVGLTILFIQYF
ncbi:hypothetical protein PQO03_15700 [Lentisphaera profundi]|uniref:Uncharacterized protein n=1 Tax=Lentisphaera profundi TaxID=1658616 RepID=A0ABY7W1H9_9BACT|nr:hypothetical protein [Lentisphaera profundi]WDE99280.1 hypothetical protein PQO03_15700 [Lentisphaera profundi]